ncbi:hypothetical protein [Ureibacillus thermosphaericus]|uniref:Uncharacterized protein n=1 Tax=Ureibacillus thermosphaericus TaxID=51173 RepID=A0A840PJQ0_URETH|nr:hypothetical protein [Ureibacillus thermosphaericus]MBB5148635.1 hypothetical protein [Ureibacillus thermosphaericus]NKZ31350.1 hypothetical protein [Ureibacillus thermosphaericus]
MLRNLKKNHWNLYFKKDIEVLGLPLFGFGESPEHGYWSRTMLKKKFGIELTEDQLNNPHGFARGQNGYYPVWNVDKLKM